MKTIEEMCAVMTAYNEGKAIEITRRGENYWEGISIPRWDWLNYDYRVKPDPKLRPYNGSEEFVNAMREHGPMVV